MNRPWDVIAELETDNSRLFKEGVLRREAQAGNDELFEGIRMALDCMITFGLRQIPEKPAPGGRGMDWEAFSLAVTGFVTRQVTGNTARDMVTRMMESATQDQWNHWYRRILIKDLRCGVSEKTVNSVVSGINSEYQVPVFSCQLAHDSANHEGKVTGSRMIEVKLDGVRVITVVYPEGRVDQFSRNGKELANFDAIRAQLAQVASGFTEPMVLDGEVMSSSFQDLMRQVHRKSNIQANDSVLHLFDVMPLADFERGRCTVVQLTRSQYLQRWHAAHGQHLPNVAVLDYEMVDLDTEEGQRQFREINRRAVDGGYEGIMIKDPTAHYENRRSVAWLKKKPVISVDLRVIDLEEGTGKNQGILGALVCEGVDQGRHILVNVGSGLTDQQRQDFWSNRDSVVGQTVEICADAITRAQSSEMYSLRFPRFSRFRDDK